MPKLLQNACPAQGRLEKASLFSGIILKLHASLPAAPASWNVCMQSKIAEIDDASRQRKTNVKNREQIVHVVGTVQWLVVISYQQNEGMVSQRRTN